MPGWPAPPQVKALITTRAGGISTGAFASLNLGLSTGDDPLSVRANRERVRAVLPAAPFWLKQVHGARVLEAGANIKRPEADAATNERLEADAAIDERPEADVKIDERPEADAAFARKPGIVCAILVADCLPVLITDRAGTMVAAAHAGWRGLAADVIGNTVGALTRHGAAAADLVAYLGPGIGPGAFEVGDDVYQAYVSRDAAAAAAFTRARRDKWLANLFQLARRALERAGVAQVYGGDVCTFSDPERFFSYRRDGVTGRMGAFIWRV